MEPRSGVVPVQGWNTTTSWFGHTKRNGDQTHNNNNNNNNNISQATISNYCLQKRICSINYCKEKAVDFKKNIKKHGLHFQILCLVLVILLLDGYHVSVQHVNGNWIIRVIEDKISEISIITEVKINSVLTLISEGHTKIGILFILLIIKTTWSNQSWYKYSY